MHRDNDNKNLLDVIEKLNVGEEYFWLPDHLTPFEHWVGHIPFAFWLMKTLKPKRFVELGSHRGNSYCAMCQAVSSLQLDSVGTAVDTWDGDVHMAQELGIYEELAKYHDPKYGAFSTLLRATFDDAQSQFADSTIDLLHIDGTHTYEAVRHDFENWLPKLTDRAVVIFHDIEVRRDNFGVWQLWEELKQRYPAFSFYHSYGLGVLAVGENQNPTLKNLFSIDEKAELAVAVRVLFSTRGNALVDLLQKNEIHKSFTAHQTLHEETLVSFAEEKKELEGVVASLNALLQTERQKNEEERRAKIWQSEVAELRASQLRDEHAIRLRLESSINELCTSTSWRATAPLRRLATKSPFLQKLIRRSLKASWWILTGQLSSRLKARRHFLNQQTQVKRSTKKIGAPSHLKLVPYYVDPEVKTQPDAIKDQKVAIHVHAFYPDVLDEILDRLKKLSANFDLFVSVPDNATWMDNNELGKAIDHKLSSVQKVIVRSVPNRGRDISPFIVEFGSELINYDIIGHFHTKKSVHDPELGEWRKLIFDCLFGGEENTEEYLTHILSRLSADAKFICPQRFPYMEVHQNGWSGNREIAAEILENFANLDIDDFPEAVFPEGMMFWARSDALRSFLQLPLKYEDFPNEPIASDGTIAHALERIVFLMNPDKDKKILQIQRAEYSEKSFLYEDQRDYSHTIAHDDIKILCYYLPQFHPIPENDEWHGKGFTEWTKVKAANPLFKDHYQQHVPHEDIGYYVIHDKEVLRQQSIMMKKAGIYGQIFYHYWFSGKLILEGPSKILLENKEINMPFCFCWANENWTRRWDGSEREVLLEQIYSAEDAKAFISYLIPFFRDERYIKIDGRPVLHIYRPSSIIGIQEYLSIWRSECEKAGLAHPFVVATLAAGAVKPQDYGMDAGAERVLYDWTGGRVPEITSEVTSYVDMEGRVFSYDSMADYYRAEIHNDDFHRFPSIVPNWDNTPRYKERSHVLHGSTPEKFQTWLEELIARATNTLPKDRRFILVNAWNEWAEGAHLEPDIRFGYAYLNSVGRALSKKPYRASNGVVKHVRKYTSAARRAKQHSSIIMVSHNWGGGVERHINDMAALLRDSGVVVLSLRINPGDGSKGVIYEMLPEKTVEIASFSLQDDPSVLSEILTGLSTRLVHVHHVADLPSQFTDWLMLVCSHAGIEYDVTLHDYFFICPRVHLVSSGGGYCGEPNAPLCNECIKLAGYPFGATSIETWRTGSEHFLMSARQRYVPDVDVADRMRRYFPSMNFVVRPHPESRVNTERSIYAGNLGIETGERHILVVGHMVAHKGSSLLYECAKYARDHNIPLKFTVLGTSDRTKDFNALGNVHVIGKFHREQITEITRSIRSGIVFFPTTIPETYSYVLTEVIMAGFYPIAFDIGAIGSRLRALGWGELLPTDIRQDIPAIVHRLMSAERRPLTLAAEELRKGRDYSEILSSYYQLDSTLN
ncbi:Lipopolysaccharide biosynthesis protein [Ochrobactrum sp. J50]|uniref:glycoside hydrolase family 99-like domain-containing protein n=1 Tax=Ochrobactrum sp. J50 TaxID=936132 RepID=UPI0011A5F43A|nr:glycoside hydrolase family 99-like domain-containing protein [Ochrobactrum sp. J50]TWH02325.1 Lipopolysaccharide biosynthesis protein [Ochrobactrum sp. J50]